MFGQYLELVRKRVPLIHNITNYVTVNDVANVLLASGASPIMADDENEVEEIISICDGLNINIGTLNERTIRSMFLAGKKSNEQGKILVLDPVGVGMSNLRTNTAKDLIRKSKFDVIRGNASEIKTLVGERGETRGVDVSEFHKITSNNIGEAEIMVKAFAKEMNCVVAITGGIDLVADRDRCFKVFNGREEMGKITGTGCQLTALIAAFAVVGKENVLEATAAAVAMMGLAGEQAFEKLSYEDGISTYRSKIIDRIYNMTGEELDKGARYEI